jgi:hypothetical protein
MKSPEKVQKKSDAGTTFPHKQQNENCPLVIHQQWVVID